MFASCMEPSCDYKQSNTVTFDDEKVYVIVNSRQYCVDITKKYNELIATLLLIGKTNKCTILCCFDDFATTG